MTPDGEPQKQKAANPTAKITVNFTDSKSPEDQLNFAGDDVCEIVPGLVESSGSRLAARYATWDC